METVGIVTTVVVAGAAIAGLAVFVVSMPDVARYRRIKRM